MSHTGHYEYVTGQGWVKTSEAIPTLESGVYFNKGNVPQYDPSARVCFESKTHKRQWMNQWGMKEGGIITNPDQRWDGPSKNRVKPSWHQQHAKARAKAWVVSQGGTAGLLDRLARNGSP